MHLLTLGAVALAAGAAHGYRDTSPFFMFSNSEILLPSSQLQSAASITSEIIKSLSHCRSQMYIIVSQEGVTSEDYRSKKTAPFLAEKVSHKPTASVRSSISIQEVLGDIDSSAWRNILETECKVQLRDIDGSLGTIPVGHDSLPSLWNVFLPGPSKSEEKRQQDLYQNDVFVASVFDHLPSQNYTVLYTTTPNRNHGRTRKANEGKQYDMESDIQDVLHMDLKRDVGDVHQAAKSKNQTLIDGPLFERYQYFTPGIFMGFLVGLLLLSILYVAISAVSSLQVSYAAFDKESGALSAKKQQ